MLPEPSGRQSAIVFQQDDRLARGLSGERDRIGRRGLGLRSRRVGIGVLEQAGVEFQREHTAHRLID